MSTYGRILKTLPFGNQIRAARTLLGVEQLDLAKKANVSIGTIRSIEAAGSTVAQVRLDTLLKVQEALEVEGITFVLKMSGAAGVIFLDPKRKRG